MSFDLEKEISDDEYEDFCEFDDYMNSLSDSKREAEIAFSDCITLALEQGKNVVPLYSYYTMWGVKCWAKERKLKF